MEELDPDLQFIFEGCITNLNFLDINLKIICNESHTDTFHKPTSLPPHTKNKIALSLARWILQIVTDDKNNQLQ